MATIIKTAVTRILASIGYALERLPLARYHSLRALGSDLVYVAHYGTGRYSGGRWTYCAAWRYLWSEWMF